MPSHKHMLKRRKPCVLVIEDDKIVLARLARGLRGRREQVEILRATNIEEALAYANSCDTTLDAAVIDLGLPGSESIDRQLQGEGIGHEPGDPYGLRLARTLRQINEELPLFGCSGQPKDWPDSFGWFREFGFPSRPFGVYDKTRQFALLKHHLYQAIGLQNSVEVFIVHSVGSPWLKEFEQLAQELGFKPEVLDKQRRQNVGWMDSIESNAEAVALAWIICTPDDWAFNIRRSQEIPVRQPRQNVVFEFGFFFGHFGRDSDRVFVFQCDEAAMPGDVKHLRNIPINKPLTDSDTRRSIIDMLQNWLPV